MEPRFRSSEIPWHLILIFLLLAAAVGAVGYSHSKDQNERIKKNKMEELSVVADLKVKQIVNWRKERLCDATAIFENNFLAKHIQEWLEDPLAPRPKREIFQWMNVQFKHLQYERISLLDAKGMVRLSVPDGREELGPDAIKLTAEAMRTKKVILSGIYRGQISKTIRLSLVVPILVSQDRGTLPVGVFLLRIDPYHFLYPLIHSWPTTSPTGETILVHHEGEEVVFLSELRHAKGTALSLRLPVSKHDLVAAMALLGKEGMVEGLDYRDKPVIAALKAIPESPWFLVSKVDQDEVCNPIPQGIGLTVILVSSFMVVAGLSIALIWRHQRVRFYRQQYEEEMKHRILAQHLDYLTRYANDIILLIDQDLKIVEANERALESYGYTRDELLQLSLMDLRSSEARSILDAQMKKVEEQNGMVFEGWHQKKDGTSFPVEASSRIIEIEGKKIYQSVIRDITERKRAEGEILRQKEFLEKVLESLTHPFYVLDANHYTIVMSNSAAQLNGLSGENTCYSITHKTDKPCGTAECSCPLEAVKETKKPVTVEHTHYDGDGNPRIFEVHGYPILDENGNVIQMVENCIDITDRKRAEEALQASEEKFRGIYQQSPIAIELYDSSGSLIDVNPKCLELFGVKNLSEVKGFRLFDDPNLSQDQKDKILNGSTVQYEGEFDFDLVKERKLYETSKSGKVWLRIHITPLYNQVREITGYLLQVEDVTERKRAEQYLKESNKRMRALSMRLQTIREEERTMIAREVHDELGQTLTALKIDLALLSNRCPAKHEPIMQKIGSMSRLIDEIIQSVRRICYQLRPGVLDDLGLVAAIELETNQFEKRTGIACKFLSNAEDLTLDRERSTAVFRILQETLTNTIRHANASRVRVGLKKRDGQLVMKVEDDGKGITHNDISSLKSLGILGMRERAGLFGGKLDIKGFPGKGTTVTLRMPIGSEPIDSPA
ncbi:MAG: PAS domain S-box protein [Deltaproteobacteria bacterium]|nr:PAS domain S-box protein [Deltaproteobacteria bacterium]